MTVFPLSLLNHGKARGQANSFPLCRLKQGYLMGEAADGEKGVADRWARQSR